ncbi:MAG: hypothetical protein ABR502_02620 [Chitinophagaceae bacterium]
MKLIALIIVLSCTNVTTSKKPATDTNTIVFPTDSNIPADTDDHNKGDSSTIALDSAGATIQPEDTSSLH